MYTSEQIFGLSGEELARLDQRDPQTPAQRSYATAPRASVEPPMSAPRALVDPTHSAIFWIGAAALLGLVLVTGQFKVEAALGGRAGRR